MDEKLDLLTRRVNVLANRSGRANSELPEMPQGMVLPADSVKDLKNSSDLVLHDERIRKNLVSVFFTQSKLSYMLLDDEGLCDNINVAS